jgi:transcriptional regulator
MDTQLTERELIIFLIVDSKAVSQRQLADILLTSHTNIKNTYNRAKIKLDKMAVLFSTPIEKID